MILVGTLVATKSKLTPVVTLENLDLSLTYYVQEGPSLWSMSFSCQYADQSLLLLCEGDHAPKGWRSVMLLGLVKVERSFSHKIQLREFGLD